MIRLLVCLLAFGFVPGSADFGSEVKERMLLRFLIEALDRRTLLLSESTKTELKEMYESVRTDTSNRWCTAVYDGKTIIPGSCGDSYDDLLSNFGDDSRVYAYVRFETGDEINGFRSKFAFITWIGPSVSPLKKAKVSTDKAFVKDIWTQFGKEFLADEKSDVKESKVLGKLEAASGAAYGTGW